MNLIAVYGSLRKTMYNHDLIEAAEYKGKYETKPVFNLYAVSSYPGLKAQGNTSVVMEVYAVDDELLEKVNQLEGYNPNSKSNDFYNRVTVNTPFGLAYTYLYVPSVEYKDLVKDGDWVEYYNQMRVNTLLHDAEII